MNFREAEAECKPGEYFKTLSGSWNEYGIQYGKTKHGTTFWTAGNTCGGDLTESHTPKGAQFDKRYGVYSKFYDDESIRVI